MSQAARTGKAPAKHKPLPLYEEQFIFLEKQLGLPSGAALGKEERLERVVASLEKCKAKLREAGHGTDIDADRAASQAAGDADLFACTWLPK